MATTMEPTNTNQPTKTLHRLLGRSLGRRQTITTSHGLTIHDYHGARTDQCKVQAKLATVCLITKK